LFLRNFTAGRYPDEVTGIRYEPVQHLQPDR
jgi:hypothetical protein